MNYTESKKRLIPPKNDFSEFNEITLEDFKEGTSLEERLTTFRKNRKSVLWDDFYGLQSSCLLPLETSYEKLR